MSGGRLSSRRRLTRNRAPWSEWGSLLRPGLSRWWNAPSLRADRAGAGRIPSTNAGAFTAMSASFGGAHRVRGDRHVSVGIGHRVRAAAIIVGAIVGQVGVRAVVGAVPVDYLVCAIAARIRHRLPPPRGAGLYHVGGIGAFPAPAATSAPPARASAAMPVTANLVAVSMICLPPCSVISSPAKRRAKAILQTCSSKLPGE